MGFLNLLLCFTIQHFTEDIEGVIMTTECQFGLFVQGKLNLVRANRVSDRMQVSLKLSCSAVY